LVAEKTYDIFLGVCNATFGDTDRCGWVVIGTLAAVGWALGGSRRSAGIRHAAAREGLGEIGRVGAENDAERDAR
jgi:hypothetical protein